MARERMEPYEERDRYSEQEPRRRREYGPSEWDRAAREMRGYERERSDMEEEEPRFRERRAQRASGPFVGVGPKGYKRKDERIREDICEQLTARGDIDATEIEVEVHDGEVNLTGFVNSRSEKRAAEDVAESVSGVRDVHNTLHLSERSQGGGFIGGPEAWGESGRWHGGQG